MPGFRLAWKSARPAPRNGAERNRDIERPAEQRQPKGDGGHRDMKADGDDDGGELDAPFRQAGVTDGHGRAWNRHHQEESDCQIGLIEEKPG
jgi:hypothetical protein